MASDSRFYQLEFRHRPVLKGDVGSLLQIQGLVVGGNKSNTVRLTMNGETFCIAEWSRRVGIKESVLRRRKRNGWPDERILATPLFPTGNRIYMQLPR